MLFHDNILVASNEVVLVVGGSVGQLLPRCKLDKMRLEEYMVRCSRGRSRGSRPSTIRRRKLQQRATTSFQHWDLTKLGNEKTVLWIRGPKFFNIVDEAGLDEFLSVCKLKITSMCRAELPCITSLNYYNFLLLFAFA